MIELDEWIHFWEKKKAEESNVIRNPIIQQQWLRFLKSWHANDSIKKFRIPTEGNVKYYDFALNLLYKKQKLLSRQPIKDRFLDAKYKFQIMDVILMHLNFEELAVECKFQRHLLMKPNEARELARFLIFCANRLDEHELKRHPLDELEPFADEEEEHGATSF